MRSYQRNTSNRMRQLIKIYCKRSKIYLQKIKKYVPKTPGTGLGLESLLPSLWIQKPGAGERDSMNKSLVSEQTAKSRTSASTAPEPEMHAFEKTGKESIVSVRAATSRRSGPKALEPIVADRAARFRDSAPQALQLESYDFETNFMRK